jgi:hypothetical protein
MVDIGLSVWHRNSSENRKYFVNLTAFCAVDKFWCKTGLLKINLDKICAFLKCV